MTSLGLAYDFFVNFLPSGEILHMHTPQPLGNFRLLAPLPLGISIDLPWGGYGYFLELHIEEDTIFSLQMQRSFQDPFADKNVNFTEQIWTKSWAGDPLQWVSGGKGLDKD